MQLLDFLKQAQQFAGRPDIMAVALEFSHSLFLLGDKPLPERDVPLCHRKMLFEDCPFQWALQSAGAKKSPPDNRIAQTGRPALVVRRALAVKG
jgi:hypothetical protein